MAVAICPRCQCRRTALLLTTWTQNGVPTTGTIGEANLDGTGIKHDLIASTTRPWGGAVGYRALGAAREGTVNLVSNGNFGGLLVQAGASGTSVQPGWTAIGP